MQNHYNPDDEPTPVTVQLGSVRQPVTRYVDGQGKLHVTAQHACLADLHAACAEAASHTKDGRPPPAHNLVRLRCLLDEWDNLGKRTSG